MLVQLTALFLLSLSVAADSSAIAEYDEIYRLYQQKSYEAAIERMHRFEVESPKSPQMPQILNLHGLAYLLTGRATQAMVQFQKSLSSGSGGENFNQYVRYNLATAQFESNQLDDSIQTLNSIKTELMDRDNRAKVRYLKSRILSKRGLWMQSARELLGAGRELPTSPGENPEEIRRTFAEALERSINEIKESNALETLFREYEDSALIDLVLFQFGSQKLKIGDREKGESLLRTLMSRFPSSQYYARAAELVRSIQDQKNAETDRNAVGVLLPMRGKFAMIGSRCLQGIEMAFKIFTKPSATSRFTLVIEDSGDEPEQTLAALNKLVSKHHVIAIIGPLLAKGIDQITQRAQELGVPMLSLARYPGVPGDYIFQAGLTLQLQAATVAKYAIEHLGIKKFAVLYPRDKVGEEASNHFWDAVESNGGSIVGAESYHPMDTDFRQAVDKLSGLYYTESRYRELQVLAREREENHIKKRTRKTEQFFALKPIVDYQAVFIPEEPKVAGQILPTFAYRDVSNVKFLGTSAWNSPELVGRAPNDAEGTVFVDAFFTGGPQPQVRKFIEKYKTSFDQEPSSVEALAYDAASVLENVLDKGTAAMTRSEVKDRLHDLRSFSGVTGLITYKEGSLQRDLKVLTFRKGKMTEF